MECNIIIGGDFCPYCNWDISPSAIWGELLADFLSSDLNIVNLEAPITSQEIPSFKDAPVLKTPPSSLELLTAAQISCVTLANNHIMDFGNLGLFDTLNLLDSQKIAHIGAGRDATEAAQVFYWKKQSIRLAFINFCENEWDYARHGHPGTARMDIVDNIHTIQEAQKNSDFVFVIIHGGIEHYQYPTPRMQKQYRFYAENGASAVIGHHQHCPCGYEIHRNVPIFYGLGNLLFPRTINYDPWFSGYLVKFTCNSKLTFEIIPYRQCENGFKIRKLLSKEKELFLDNVENLHLTTKEEALLQKKWNDFIIRDNRISKLFLRAIIPVAFLQKVFSKLKLERFFQHQQFILSTYHLTMCQSYLDVYRDKLYHRYKKICNKMQSHQKKINSISLK